jgi:hypothetical protein
MASTTRRARVAAILILAGMAGTAKAQDIVPGGWSQEFRYQSLGPVSPMPANPYASGWGGSNAAYSPYGLYRPSMQQSAGFSGYVGPPAMSNTLVPLGGAIRRTTHSRRPR